MMGLVKVDGRRRTDPNFPCGFNDVISLDKTDEHDLTYFESIDRIKVPTADGVRSLKVNGVILSDIPADSTKASLERCAPRSPWGSSTRAPCPRPARLPAVCRRRTLCRGACDWGGGRRGGEDE